MIRKVSPNYLSQTLNGLNVSEDTYVTRELFFEHVHLSYKSQLLASAYQKQSPELFCEKSVLKNFVKFTGKHLCQSIVFIWIILCLFLGFPLLTLSMNLFAGKGVEKQLLLCESLKCLTQQTYTNSKLATEILKQDVKSVKS